jgi:maltoporin
MTSKEIIKNNDYKVKAEELEKLLLEFGFEKNNYILITNAIQLITPENPFEINLRINISTDGYMEFDEDDIFIAGKRFYFDHYTVKELLDEIYKRIRIQIADLQE